MAKIYKHCRKEHNVALGCHTLQLGTLDYYASMDPNLPSADQSEGRREMHGSAGEYLVTDLSPLTGPSAKIIDTKGGAKIIAGKLNLKTKETNGYIFSCSLNSQNNGIFPDYDSCFSFESPDSAAHVIGELLSSQIDFLDLEMDKSAWNGVLLQCQHSKVNYLDEDAFEFSDHTILKVRENNKHDIAFTKPKRRGEKRYCQEEEYRLCFWAFDKKTGKQIGVKPKPKLVKIPSLMNKSSNNFHQVTKDVPIKKSVK